MVAVILIFLPDGSVRDSGWVGQEEDISENRMVADAALSLVERLTDNVASLVDLVDGVMQDHGRLIRITNNMMDLNAEKTNPRPGRRIPQ